jgi:hypothetical protein
MSKYPQVKIELVGQDGNAFSIMGRAAAAARRAGLSKEVIDAYRNEAMSGDYDNLLVTTMEWFDCDSDDSDVDPYSDEYEDDDYDDDEDEYDDDENELMLSV